MSNITIDYLDKLILAEISKDPSCSLASLNLGPSYSIIKSRVEKLIDCGYICTDTPRRRIRFLTLKGTEALDGDFYPALAPRP